jgi:Amt family ammonium transporter
LIVYCPLAHMVWGGGWIGELGAKDFAGGLVVHMSSGFSALVACIILGPRLGHGKEAVAPHNLPYTVIGASLLWVGWFGFNAGSELAADGTAALAFLTTNTAAASAVLAWAAIERVHLGKPTVLGGATGAVAGLVAITPACAFVTPGGAIAIGIGAGAICYFFVAVVKKKFGYDDSLDVFGVHGIGGTWGAIAVAIFLADFVEPAGGSKLTQLWVQIQSIGFTAIFAPVATAAILYGMKTFMTLRADADEETDGLDYALHGETAYGSGGSEH